MLNEERERANVECTVHLYKHNFFEIYFTTQNPDIVLVHYLNVPYPDDNKMAVITPSLALWGDKKEWTKEELVSQLKPMCTYRNSLYEFKASFFSLRILFQTVFSEDEPDATNEIEISVSFFFFFAWRENLNVMGE